MLLLFPLWGLVGYAQEKEKDSHLPEGNKAFAEKKFADAEAEYRISESKYKKKAIASYNLGNAVYRQNQAAEANYHYTQALKNAKTREEKFKAYHNIGNTFMKSKEYSSAVESYKNGLRNNPSDEETRYNYALAKEYLKNNPPPKKDNKKKDKNEEKKKDKKDQKDKDKEKDKDQNKDKNNDKEKKDNKDQSGEKPQPQPGGTSKQRIENLLDAVNNEEKKIQDKVNKQKVQANPKKTEKDW